MISCLTADTLQIMVIYNRSCQFRTRIRFPHRLVTAIIPDTISIVEVVDPSPFGPAGSSCRLQQTLRFSLRASLQRTMTLRSEFASCSSLKKVEVQVGPNLAVVQGSPTGSSQLTGYSLSWLVWSQFEHPHQQETLVPVTSNPYPTYNGHQWVFKKVHRHSGIAVLVDTVSRSRKYSRIQSNVQYVPRDLWPGKQSANGHNQFLYLAGIASFAYQTQRLQQLTQ